MDVRDFLSAYELVEVTKNTGDFSCFPRKWEVRDSNGIACGVIFDTPLAEKLGAKPLVKATA